MKKLFLFIIASFIFFTVSSQNKDSLNKTPNYLKNEVGFDMVFFLNILRNQWESSNTTQLIFNYDRWLSPKNALRFTLGIGYYHNETKNDTFPLLTEKNSNDILKIGLKREQRVGKRWLFYYGADADFRYDFTQYQQGNTSTGVITTTDLNMYYGASPFMGLRFEINPHISFTIETNVNLLFFSRDSKSENDKFSEQNTHTSINGFGLTYFIPENVFFKIKF